MVISNPDLEELLSPLGFALAAALEGIEVRLYVQGPAVRILGRGARPVCGDGPGSSVASPGGAWRG